ncbi:hypothetical protein OG21DRAFT_779713 [Imleria badia]|nr:hypothetical protein OG21DRAFT_779713 [Imleria badia]
MEAAPGKIIIDEVDAVGEYQDVDICAALKHVGSFEVGFPRVLMRRFKGRIINDSSLSAGQRWLIFFARAQLGKVSVTLTAVCCDSPMCLFYVCMSIPPPFPLHYRSCGRGQCSGGVAGGHVESVLFDSVASEGWVGTRDTNWVNTLQTQQDPNHS